MGEATTRRGFFAMLAAVAAAPFAPKPEVHWLGAIEREDGGFLVPSEHPIFDIVSVTDEHGHTTQVPRLNGNAKARFIDG